MDAWLFLLRWFHFLAGITWIGMLYYFNFVQVPALALVVQQAVAVTELDLACHSVHRWLVARGGGRSSPLTVDVSTSRHRG